jgi:hypothetical protein
MAFGIRRGLLAVAVVALVAYAIVADDLNDWIHRPTEANNPQTTVAHLDHPSSERKVAAGDAGSAATSPAQEQGTVRRKMGSINSVQMRLPTNEHNRLTTRSQKRGITPKTSNPTPQ